MNKINKVIDSAELSGYKTIKDLKVEFEEGLNILIGKNSSGKSNYLDFLYYNLSFNFYKLNNFTSEINYSDETKIKISKNTSIAPVIENTLKFDQDLLSDKIQYTIYNKGVKLENQEEYSSPSNFFFQNKITYELVKICHGLPKNKYFIADDLSLSLKGNNLEDSFFNTLRDDNITSFTKNIMLSIVNWFFGLRREFPDESLINIEQLRTRFKDKMKDLFLDLNMTLPTMTSIEEIRINNSFELSLLQENYTIRNLRLEYLVDGEWLNFESLSDGTKRIFYIVSETLSFIDDENSLLYSPIALINHLDQECTKKIILLEEPELGIHPYQLHKLLLFLKEESETKQIVLTTHSPMALNILNYESLDKVLVFKKVDRNTVVEKISEDEKKKIHHFINDSGLFLSDYWMFANNDF